MDGDGLASDEIKKFNIKDNRGFVITQSLKKLKGEDRQMVFDKLDWGILNNLKNLYNLETIENILFSIIIDVTPLISKKVKNQK